jgi:omega-amidase
MAHPDALQPGQVRVAVLQFDMQRSHAEKNLERVLLGLNAAAARGAQLLVLPEMWATSFAAGGGPFGSPEAQAAAIDSAERALAEAGRAAAGLGLALVGSGFGPPAADGRPPNRLTWQELGQIRLAYDKVHRFGPTGEPLAFARGNAPPEVLTWQGLRASGIVCYDLRFGPLFEELLWAGVELLCVPCQWPTPRQAHLEALARGRAVELQAYVLVSNRCGREPLGRRGRWLEFGGGSLILGPDGLPLAQAGPGEALIFADLDPERVRELRREVPVRSDWSAADYAQWRARRADA